jgi:hypothetical protein
MISSSSRLLHLELPPLHVILTSLPFVNHRFSSNLAEVCVNQISLSSTTGRYQGHATMNSPVFPDPPHIRGLTSGASDEVRAIIDPP